MRTKEEIEAIAIEFFPDDKEVKTVHHSLRFFRMKLRDAFTEGYLDCQKHYEQKILLIEMLKEHADNEDDICGYTNNH